MKMERRSLFRVFEEMAGTVALTMSLEKNRLLQMLHGARNHQEVRTYCA